VDPDDLPLANLVQPPQEDEEDEEDPDDDVPLSTLFTQLRRSGYEVEGTPDDWLTTDKDEQTAAKMTSDDIVMEVQAQQSTLKEQLEASQPEEEEDDDEEEEEKNTVLSNSHPISGLKEALSYIHTGLLKCPDAAHLLSMLTPLEHGLNKLHGKEMKQSSIQDYFRK
jgi:hypothetical protein